jgi:hypothetical protein
MPSYHSEMERIVKVRKGGNWAILVADDGLACMYQRMKFRLERARWACGARALLGYSSFGENGFSSASPEEVEEINRCNFRTTHFNRAVKAKRVMQDKSNPRDAFENYQNEQEPEEYYGYH